MTQIQVTHNSDFNVSYTDNFGPVQYSDGNHSTVLLTDTITQPGGWLDQAFSGEKPWLMVAAPTTPHVETANNEHKYPIPPTPEVKYQDAFPDFKVPRTPDFNPDTVCTLQSPGLTSARRSRVLQADPEAQPDGHRLQRRLCSQAASSSLDC